MFTYYSLTKCPCTFIFHIHLESFLQRFLWVYGKLAAFLRQLRKFFAFPLVYVWYQTYVIQLVTHFCLGISYTFFAWVKGKHLCVALSRKDTLVYCIDLSITSTLHGVISEDVLINNIWFVSVLCSIQVYENPRITRYIGCLLLLECTTCFDLDVAWQIVFKYQHCMKTIFHESSFWILGLYSLRRRRLIGIGIPIINLRPSQVHVGIPIPWDGVF